MLFIIDSAFILVNISLASPEALYQFLRYPTSHNCGVLIAVVLLLLFMPDEHQIKNSN